MNPKVEAWIFEMNVKRVVQDILDIATRARDSDEKMNDEPRNPENADNGAEV